MADAHPASESAESPNSLATALRTLPPIEEKVLRLSYGIGCQRAHSTAEIAAAFGMRTDLVETILDAAEQHVAEHGVPLDRLQQFGAPVSGRRHRCRNRSAEGD